MSYSMRTLLQILSEAQETDDAMQDYLRQTFEATVFMASKARALNLGAALFHALDVKEKFEYFDQYVIPRLENAGFPKFHSAEMLQFQSDLKDLWLNEKHQKEIAERWGA